MQHKQLIYNYISALYAKRVFKQDKELFTFEKFETYKPYHDRLHSIINQLTEDIYKIEKYLYGKSFNVRYVGKTDNTVTFEWSTGNEKGLYVFTPDELKTMTSEMMSKYLHGEKARPNELSDDPWF